MKSFLAILGILALSVLALAGAGFAYLTYQGSKLDREAAAYSQTAAIAITAQWDDAALLARATPQLAGSISRDKLDTMFTWFGTLGKLEGTPACKGSSGVFAGPGGVKTTGSYTCTAQYRVGVATLSLRLVKAGNAWLINGFHVTSPALVPPAPKGG